MSKIQPAIVELFSFRAGIAVVQVERFFAIINLSDLTELSFKFDGAQVSRYIGRSTDGPIRAKQILDALHNCQARVLIMPISQVIRPTIRASPEGTGWGLFGRLVDCGSRISPKGIWPGYGPAAGNQVEVAE